MRPARRAAIEATVAFARDTDDPAAALAAFRQVLDEADELWQEAVNSLREPALDPAGLLLAMGQEARAYSRMMVLAHGLAALVERCMEPWDEERHRLVVLPGRHHHHVDTWGDFLRDEKGAAPRCEGQTTIDEQLAEAAYWTQPEPHAEEDE